MAAIEQQIPNLLGGVSQQPDPVKLPGQVKEANNVLLDPTFGCMKRPPTQWIASLGNNIPEDAEWFPIFRDNAERYLAVVYRETDLIVRVFDVLTGTERTVVIDPEWNEYSATADPTDLRSLTIADYTLLCNTQGRVTSTRVAPEEKTNDALVTIGQVSYNTTYNIDLGGPGAEPVVVTRATKLQINPASWKDEDETCGFDGTEQFTEDDDNGPGQGLNFRIVTQGTAFRPKPDKDNYDCRYQTDVILQNGGNGWRVGDKIKVEMKDKEYEIKVVETTEETVYASLGTATFTTPPNAEADGGLTLGDITSGLVNGINSLSNFEATSVSNVIRIKRADNSKFTISTRGGLSGSAMESLISTAADVSELPKQCFDGYFLEIVNTEDAEADNYYVIFKSDIPGQPGPGSWEETVKIGDKEYLNSLSMPFALTREADGNFALGPLNEESALEGWAGREVGDATTNPSPSFVGKAINGMFLHRNRLGFLTEEAAVLSQPGDYFNFFATSGVALSDADPVDMSASDTKPVILRDAIATPQGVVLFGEQAQFRLFTAESTFGPNTVELKKISAYSYASEALPQLTGVSVMFNTSVGEYTKVFELSTASLRQDVVIQENTRSVPRYLPTEINWSCASVNNDLVLYGDKKDIYAFRYFNQGDSRVVAGWTKWIFHHDILFGAAQGDELYFVVRREGYTHLHVATLLDGPESPIDVDFTQFRPRVDAQVSMDDLTVVGDVDLPNGRTVTEYRFPTNYAAPGLDFQGVAAYTDVRTGEYDEVLITGDTFRIDKDREFIFGYQYETKVVMPSFYTKVASGDNARADRISNPMIQTVYLELFNSGAMEVQIEVNGYPTRDVDLPLIESDNYAASDVVVIENKTVEVPIYHRGEDVTLTVRSDTPFPTSMTGFSWSGTYNKRGYARM